MWRLWTCFMVLMRSLCQANALVCLTSLIKNNFDSSDAFQQALIRCKWDIFRCRRPRRWRLFLILLRIIFARHYRTDNSSRWYGVSLWGTVHDMPTTVLIPSPTRVCSGYHLLVSNSRIFIDWSSLTCAPTCGLLAVVVVLFARRRSMRRSWRFATTTISRVERSS